MKQALGWISLSLLMLIGTLAAGVHSWRAYAQAELGVCYTPSVPRGLYALYKPSPRPARGSYACLLGVDEQAPFELRKAIATGLAPASGRRTPLLKLVAGVAGDIITYEREQVHVNGRPLVNSKAKRANSLGQRLPMASFPITLGVGEVWLAATHEHGFDSRYFGPVRVEVLRCEGRPLWTF
jgi:conjugative transfer signal peptidase TraF